MIIIGPSVIIPIMNHISECNDCLLHGFIIYVCSIIPCIIVLLHVINNVQFFQSNEVASSVHMELEGLKRSLVLLEAHDAIVTDRHVQIKKYMREQQPSVQHLFDVWHIAKGKKVTKPG